MTIAVLGIDPAPTKSTFAYDGEQWLKWEPQDLRDRVLELKGPAILAWDAPLSFDRTDFFNRTVDATVGQWADRMEANHLFDPKAVNACPFAGLSHWTVTCDALGMPFGQKPPGFNLAKTPPTEASSSIAVIEVHPAVAIGIWWLEKKPGVPLPVYKGKGPAKRAASRKIASTLGFPVDLDAGRDDDHLDAYVAYLLGIMFRDNKAHWLGSPEKGGYVLPDGGRSEFFSELQTLYEAVDEARTAKREHKRSLKRKNLKPCPKCGSPDVVPIVYGEPGSKLIDEERQGKIFLGGCVVGDRDPQKHCKACGTEFDLQPSHATRRPRLKK